MPFTARWKWSGGALAAVALAAPVLMAADHRDSPSVTADPAADINDTFAWMSPDAARLNLVMTVYPEAPVDAKFSDLYQYVFHTRSGGDLSATANATTGTDVICTFNAAQTVQCWAGGSYVSGDASVTGGITSKDGKLRVFAGLRADPAFFNLEGFMDFASTVQAAAASLPLDAAGCPSVNAQTSSVLVNMLKSTQQGTGPAKNFFATLNTLALVVSVDKSLVTQGGKVVSVWASTRK